MNKKPYIKQSGDFTESDNEDKDLVTSDNEQMTTANRMKAKAHYRKWNNSLNLGYGKAKTKLFIFDLTNFLR